MFSAAQACPKMILTEMRGTSSKLMWLEQNMLTEVRIGRMKMGSRVGNAGKE